MRKKIRQHIRKRNYVTVYITDRDSTVIAHYNGVLLAQSDCLLLIGVMYDFFYDGLVLVRKRDISEIRYSKKEKFFNQVIENEGIKGEFLNKWLGFIFELTDVAGGLGVLHKLNLPVIIEGKYNKTDRFIIGPIVKTGNKKVKVRHFDAEGKFEIKPVSIRYKEITIVQFDSPYADIFYKYAHEP